MRRLAPMQPSRTTTGVLAIDGDSITAGFGVSAGQDWPSVAVPQIDGDFVMTNLAISGQTLTQILATATDVDALLTPSAKWGSGSGARNVYCFMAGRNDLSFDSQLDAVTCFARIEAIVAARRAAGWNRIVIGTVTRSGTTALYETRRRLVNAYLRRRTDLYDALADSDAAPELQDTTNTTYYQDGVHPTAAGMVVLAGYFADAINEAVSL